jgi:hypothetical protein
VISIRVHYPQVFICFFLFSFLPSFSSLHLFFFSFPFLFFSFLFFSTFPIVIAREMKTSLFGGFFFFFFSR